MEVIIALGMILVEIIVGTMIPLLMVTIELIGIVIAVIVDFVVYVLFNRGSTKKTVETRTTPEKQVDEQPVVERADDRQATVVPAPPHVEPAPRTGLQIWTRRIAITGAVASGISIVGLLAANFLFFESVVRFATNRVAKRSDIKIDFDGARGSLFTGRIEFEKLDVAREGHPSSDYEIHLDRCAIKLSVMSVLKKERRVESIEASGVRGTYKRVAPADEAPRKPFVVEHLSIQDAALNVTDRTPPGGVAEVKLELDSFVIDDYESQWPVLDILFSSNAIGKIDGEPFQITCSTGVNEQMSQWKAARVPLPLVVTYLGGPFRILREGNAEILVENNWKTEVENPKIDMHWKITFSELKAGVPADAGELYAKFLDPVVGHLKLQNGKLPLDFHVVIDQNAFRGKSSLASIGLWTVVRESAVRTFEDKVGAKFDVIVERAIDAAGAVKEAAERIRKAREEGKGLRERMKNFFGRDNAKGEVPAADGEPDPETPAVEKNGENNPGGIDANGIENSPPPPPAK